MKKKSAFIPLAAMLDDPGFARNLKVEALSSVHDPRLLCALIDETVALAQVGRKFARGRKVASVGPWRKRISAMLGKSPAMKNVALWEELKKRPPRGWAHRQSAKFGERFEGPKAGEEFKYSTFLTYASEERSKLKAKG